MHLKYGITASRPVLSYENTTKFNLLFSSVASYNDFNSSVHTQNIILGVIQNYCVGSINEVTAPIM